MKLDFNLPLKKVDSVTGAFLVNTLNKVEFGLNSQTRKTHHIPQNVSTLLHCSALLLSLKGQ